MMRLEEVKERLLEDTVYFPEKAQYLNDLRWMVKELESVKRCPRCQEYKNCKPEMYIIHKFPGLNKNPWKTRYRLLAVTYAYLLSIFTIREIRIINEKTGAYIIF